MWFTVFARQLANFPRRIAHWSMRVIARFLAAATDAAHFPAPSVPEVAFLGRSNVGKSSVINTLVGDKTGPHQFHAGAHAQY